MEDPQQIPQVPQSQFGEPPSYQQAPPQMLPPTDKKWLMPAVILGVFIIAGIVVWALVSKKSSQNEQVQQTSPTETPMQRQEFPWNLYQVKLSVAPSSRVSTLIAQTADIAAYGQAALVITKTLNAAAGTKIQKAYVFDTVNLAVNGRIETLYVEETTSLFVVGVGTTIGQKVVLSHNDLVGAAEAAAGIQAQGSPGAGQTTTPTPGTATPTPGSTPTRTPTPTATATPTGPNPFMGNWSGSFTPNSIAASGGCLGGTASFTVASDGKFQGPVIISGAIFYGGGTIDMAGNISGGWAIGSNRISITGKMSGNGGSGSYSDKFGCFGSFSVSR